jgi:hypothetical protein
MAKSLMRRSTGFAALAALMGAVSFTSPARADVTLVENGVAKSAIVLPEKPTTEEARAAKEIQVFVARISGATLDVVNTANALQERTPILIGRAAPAALAAAIKAKSEDTSAFALFVDGKSVALRGLESKTDLPLETDFATFAKKLDTTYYSGKRMIRGGLMPQGTRNAAYELLEQLGMRWYFPGELGTVTPQQKTLVLKDQKTVQIPSFPARQMSGIRNDDWQERMRHGGPNFPSSHGAPGFSARESKELFKEHPEYFALVDGKRTTRQLNISNPAVIARVVEYTKKYFRAHPDADIIGMGANDGRGYCEDAECRALDGGDFDPFGNAPSMTDRYVWFFNQVLDGIKDEFPDKRIGFYAYGTYNRPPVRWKPNKNLVPAVALITLCRIHGVGNPVCAEKSYQKEIVRSWGKLVPEVYDRGYWFNLADPGLPFFMIQRVTDEIRIGKELGTAGWRVESAYNWCGSAPSLYVASRLMWNKDTDVPALMADFYDKFFGPAARPMQTYIETMDNAVYYADYHTGSSWDAQEIYNSTVRDTARKALADAAKLAPQGTLYAQRVEMYDKDFDYLEAFVTMIESRANHDYATSMNALKKMDALREDLRNHEHPLMTRNAESYMKRFFRVATEQSYERTTGGNELVAGLADKWQFQIDPEKIGETINLSSPNLTGGQWQTVAPYTTSWSNIGLRYYKGDAWYRQSVTIPAKFKDKRIFLWFGGVDEAAKVWVNGRLIGESRGSFKPFELDATEAVRAGEPNVVVVKITNDQLNEIGTGGIVAPVMFFAPAKGKDAVPQGGIAPAVEDVETIAEDN